jgi:GNAT superfamily N-acetyltransferase
MSEHWPDLERLFGEKGAFGGCWCMWWRLTGPQYKECRGQANKDAFKAVVESGEVPGILAYSGDEPIGWCAIAPRDAYLRLREERIRIFKSVDDRPVWSVTCFFVAKPFREQGMMLKLLQAAVAFAGEQGAQIVEGYPIDSEQPVTREGAFAVGPLSTFRKAGFVEVARRHEARPIMRYYFDSATAE